MYVHNTTLCLCDYLSPGERITECPSFDRYKALPGVGLAH